MAAVLTFPCSVLRCQGRGSIFCIDIILPHVAGQPLPSLKLRGGKRSCSMPDRVWWQRLRSEHGKNAHNPLEFFSTLGVCRWMKCCRTPRKGKKKINTTKNKPNKNQKNHTYQTTTKKTQKKKEMRVNILPAKIDQNDSAKSTTRHPWCHLTRVAEVAHHPPNPAHELEKRVLRLSFHQLCGTQHTSKQSKKKESRRRGAAEGVVVRITMGIGIFEPKPSLNQSLTQAQTPQTHRNTLLPQR